MSFIDNLKKKVANLIPEDIPSIPDEVVKLYTEQDEKTDKYLLIGLPNSGKTVFFCVCMDILQRKFNRLGSDYSVVYETAKTDQMVRKVISSLREKGKDGWPANTQETDVHNVTLTFKKHSSMLSFKDYSGEAFIEAFGEDEPDISDEPSDETGTAIFASDLKEDIRKSTGVLLLVDATVLKDSVNEQLSVCLFNLLGWIDQCGLKDKLGVVITKGDLVKDMGALSVQEAFMNQQPNSYARIKRMNCDKRFFIVTAVDCDIDENGNSVPPLNYTPLNNSKNVCEPIEWMMNFDADQAGESL